MKMTAISAPAARAAIASRNPGSRKRIEGQLLAMAVAVVHARRLAQRFRCRSRERPAEGGLGLARDERQAAGAALPMAPSVEEIARRRGRVDQPGGGAEQE